MKSLKHSIDTGYYPSAKELKYDERTHQDTEIK